MPVYRAYGLAIDCEIDLPELPEVTAPPDGSVRVTDDAPPESPAWYHHWRVREGDAPTASAARHGDDYFLRFVGLADFLLSGDGTRISLFRASAAAPAVTVRHLLLDRILPCSLAARDETALHASAVVTPGGAACFLGPSGQGKSTLAVELAQSGCGFLADDCLRVVDEGGALVAHPAYPSARLWPDSAAMLFGAPSTSASVAADTSKRRVSGQPSVRFADTPAPLRIAYVLTSPAESEHAAAPMSESLSPRAAVLALLGQLHRLDTRDPARLLSELDRLALVVKRLPFRRLTFAHRGPVAADILRIIESDTACAPSDT